MSIPRDSLVPIPGHGTTKINAAFAFGGPKLLIRTIEQNTGIHIDHYVEIGLGGFVNIVDSVGGVTICPSHTMNDKLANLHVKKGCQHADGTVALAYARSRHADPQLGDIARGGQQREVMAAVGHKALSPWTVLNPFRYWNLWTSTTENLIVDDDMSVAGHGPLRLGDDPQRPHLPGPDQQPGGDLGPDPVQADVQAHPQRRHLGDQQEPLHQVGPAAYRAEATQITPH